MENRLNYPEEEKPINITNQKSMKRKAWIVVLTVFVAGIAMAWSQNKIPPVISEVMADLSVSMSTAGWLSSIFCVMGIIMAIPSAGLIVKLGLKKSGLLALSATILGVFIGIIAPNAALLLLSRLIEGIGVGLIAVLAPAVIAMWFPPEKRGLPMGIWGSWQMVGQSAAFIFASTIMAGMGWKGMWWVGLVILVIAFLLYIWKIASPPAGYNHADMENDSINIFQVFRYKSVWMIAMIAFLFCFGCFGFCTWVATYWHEVMGMDIDRANALVGYLYMFEIAVVIFEGWLLDKIKSRKTFGVITSIIYIAVLFVCFRLPSTSFILPFVIIYPFFEGAICTTFWTITPQTVPNPSLSGGALALLVIGMNLGMVLGPPIVGGIIENFGWATATIPMAIAILICAILFATMQLYNESGEKIKG